MVLLLRLLSELWCLVCIRGNVLAVFLFFVSHSLVVGNIAWVSHGLLSLLVAFDLRCKSGQAE